MHDDLRLAPVGERLAELLGRAGAGARRDTAPETLPGDPVVLLENLRFDPGEEADDQAFAGRLAELADAYVDDAFGAAHRAHASVSRLARADARERTPGGGRPADATRGRGALAGCCTIPARPYVAILGGAKVSDKLAVIESLIDRVDALLIGGAMAFTFIAADGGEVGDSLCERDRFDEVRAAQAAGPRARRADRGAPRRRRGDRDLAAGRAAHGAGRPRSPAA